MTIRVPTMGKASAKVSTMVTPLIFSSDMAGLARSPFAFGNSAAHH